MFLTKYSGMIIGPVASLLGLCMNGIFSVLNMIGLPNIGLSIIIMTILIYMAMLPLTIKQQKFSKLQRKMQPELNKINKKYEGRKDPESMERQQAEIKEVYGKYGVSATGSCVQLLIQMPILLALYRVFYNIPAYVPLVKQAFFPLVDKLIAVDPNGEFLQTFNAARYVTKQFENESFVNGVVEYVQNTFIDVLNKFSSADWAALSEHFKDLSGDITNTVTSLSKYNNFLGLNISDTPTYMIKTAFVDKHFILLIGAILIPFLAFFTQWVNTKLMPQQAPADGKVDPDDPTAQMQQSMKTMNIMMPMMSAVFCLSLPAGMGIYWIIGAVIRSVQQVLINKHIDKKDIDAEIAKNIEKYKKKQEKLKATPQMNRYANMSTKNIETKATNSVSLEKRELELQKVRDSFSGKEIKKDSLLAKANMVKDFNEKNNK